MTKRRRDKTIFFGLLKKGRIDKLTFAITKMKQQYRSLENKLCKQQKR